MNFDKLEELIRKYLSAGMTAIVIIIAPGTGSATDGTPSEPEIRVVEPAPSEPEREPAREPEPKAGTGTDPDRTGASGSNPGADEEGTTGGRTPSRTGNGTERDTGTRPDTGTSADEGTGSDTGSDTDSDTGGSSGESSSSESGSESGSGSDSGSDSGEDSSPEATGEESETGTDTGGTGSDSESGETGDTGTRSAPDAGSRSSETGSESGTGDSGSARETTEEGTTGEDGAAEESGGTARESSPGTSGTGSDTGGNTNVEGTTAAEVHGWGTPEREDDFSGGLDQWSIYNGPGHAGQGIRSPAAASTRNGILTITGDSEGTTAGMAWNPGHMYGRWEGRVRAPESDESYNALLLLWPDAENFPVGGEIDFMEMLDHTRQSTDIFIHYGADNSQVNGQVEIDATEWHNWAVEWTPEAITAYVDGEEWYRTTDTDIFPPGPMHLCVQLDWFPGDAEGAVQESQMHVDWVRYYPLDESTASESGSRRGTGESARESTETSSDEDASSDQTGTTTRRWAGVTGESSENRGQSEETDPFSRIREAIRRLFYWR